jgi:hypothetical protein
LGGDSGDLRLLLPARVLAGTAAIMRLTEEEQEVENNCASSNTQIIGTNSQLSGISTTELSSPGPQLPNSLTTLMDISEETTNHLLSASILNIENIKNVVVKDEEMDSGIGPVQRSNSIADLTTDNLAIKEERLKEVTGVASGEITVESVIFTLPLPLSEEVVMTTDICSEKGVSEEEVLTTKLTAEEAEEVERIFLNYVSETGERISLSLFLIQTVSLTLIVSETLTITPSKTLILTLAHTLTLNLTVMTLVDEAVSMALTLEAAAPVERMLMLRDALAVLLKYNPSPNTSPASSPTSSSIPSSISSSNIPSRERVERVTASDISETMILLRTIIGNARNHPNDPKFKKVKKSTKIFIRLELGLGLELDLERRNPKPYTVLF